MLYYVRGIGVWSPLRSIGQIRSWHCCHRSRIPSGEGITHTNWGWSNNRSSKEHCSLCIGTRQCTTISIPTQSIGITGIFIFYYGGAICQYGCRLGRRRRKTYVGFNHRCYRCSCCTREVLYFRWGSWT